MIRQFTYLTLLILLGLSAKAQEKAVEDYFRMCQLLKQADTTSAFHISQKHSARTNAPEVFQKTYTDLLFAQGKYTQTQEFVEDKTLKTAHDYYILACSHAAMKHADMAIQALTQHIEKRQHHLRGELYTDPCFHTIRNSSEWQEFWMHDHYTRAEQDYEEALNYYHDSSYQWAQESINALMAKDRPRAKYYALRSRILKATNNFQAARKDIRNALSSAPRQADYQLLHAQILFEMGKENQALHAIETAITEAPFNRDLYLWKAIILNANRNYRKAKRILDFYLGYFENELTRATHAQISYNLHLYWDAIEDYNKLIDLAPSKIAYRTGRADAFYATKAWEKAAEDYSMALDISPGQPEVYIRLGVAKYESGDQKSACYWWRKALHYKHPEANQYLYQYCR